MGMNWAMKPLTNAPSIYAKKLADRVDQPNPQTQRAFDPNTYAGRYEDFANKLSGQVKGGIAGGIEGAGNLLSDMTSPFSLATTLTGTSGIKNLIRGGQAISQGVQGVKRAIEPTIDIIDSPAIKQVMPSFDDVGSLIGDMQRNLARIPSRGMSRATQAHAGIAPSMLPSELVEMGGEGLYNMNRARQMSSHAPNIEDIAEAGSRAAGRARMPFGDINLQEMMASLARARGR